MGIKMTLAEAHAFAKLWNEAATSGCTRVALAKSLGVVPGSVSQRRERAEMLLGVKLPPLKPTNIPVPVDASDTLSESAAERLREARADKAELLQLRATREDTERLRALYQGGLEHVPAPPPWLFKTTLKPKCLGTPTLFISDLHWGEHVDPKQINGVNQYDMAIARARLERVFRTAIVMLYDHLQPGGYPGLVLALGGDMVSGNIHEELRETNDESILAIVLDLFDHLVAGIDMLLRAGVPQLFIPCVVGNHGRLDKKPRAKGAVQDNYEWILYQLLLRHYAQDKRVTVIPSDSLDYVYQVAGTTYLLTHGDQFKGGSGISGPFTPWMLGDHKKRKRQNAIAQPYDYMIFGHFHMLVWGPSFICNGSLKGYDEWSFRMNFGFEPPQQALWITHPRHGITVKMEIGAEESDRAGSESMWVKVRGG